MTTVLPTNADRGQPPATEPHDARPAPDPVGPPYKALQGNFSTGLTPRQPSYASLIEIADLGRRSVGLAPDQDGAPGAGLGLDGESRVYIEPALEDRLVSVPAFAALTADQRAEIWDLLVVLGDFEIQAIVPAGFKRMRVEWSESSNATSYMVYRKDKTGTRIVAETSSLSALLDYEQLLAFEDFVETNIFVVAKNGNAEVTTVAVTLDADLYFAIRGRAEFRDDPRYAPTAFIAMSDDGSLLINSCFESSSKTGGEIVINRLDQDNKWTRMQIITKQSAYHIGVGLALSGDGKRLAFGWSEYTKDNIIYSKHFKVDYYEFDAASDTFIYRQTIPEQQFGEIFGEALALNRNGSLLYVGSPNKEQGQLTGPGRMQVYRLQGGVYTLDIEHIGESQWFGVAIACWHGDAIVCAISDGTTVYRFDARGGDVRGSITINRDVGANDYFENMSMSLNEDATLLAIGDVGDAYSYGWVGVPNGYGHDKIEIVDFVATTMTVVQTLKIPAITGFLYGKGVAFASNGSLAANWRTDDTYAIVYPPGDRTPLSTTYQTLAAESPLSLVEQAFFSSLCTARAGSRIAVCNSWSEFYDYGYGLLIIY